MDVEQTTKLKSSKETKIRKGDLKEKRREEIKKEKGLMKTNFVIEYFDVVLSTKQKQRRNKKKERQKQGTKRKQKRKTRRKKEKKIERERERERERDRESEKEGGRKRLRRNKGRHSKINNNALLRGKTGFLY